MKSQEIRELSDKELEEKLSDLKEEQFNLKFQLATGKIQNPGGIVHLRRDIARVMTILNERKRAKADTAPASATEDTAKA